MKQNYQGYNNRAGLYGGQRQQVSQKYYRQEGGFQQQQVHNG